MAENHEREMEKLSRAIVEAILNSKDVKQAIEKLIKIEENSARSLMVFVLRLDSLSEFRESGYSEIRDMHEDETEEIEPERPRKRRIRRKTENPDIVDGKQISINEKKFLEYLSEKFDTKKWLKRNRISLD